MPKSCAVYQCSATSENEKNRSFHQFPKDPKLRQAWIARIRREGFTPSASSYVCSFHFSEEDFNKCSSSTTPREFQKKTLKKGSIPCWNLRGAEGDQRLSTRTTLVSQRSRCPENPATSIELPLPIPQPSAASVSMEWDNNEQATSNAHQNQLEVLKNALSIANKQVAALEIAVFKYDVMSAEDIKNYTGLEKTKFDAVKEMIDRFKPLNYWTGKAVTSISGSDQLLIFLMRLKLDLPYFDLARRYSVSTTTIQNIFLTYLNIFHETFFTGCMDKMPSLEKNKCTMPASFADIPNCRTLIDCTELFIDTPRKDLEAAAVSYSNYKHRLTAKYLIAVAPNGSITFVSDGYPGSTSDKVITDQSQVISSLKAGDLILADKGFMIHDLVPKGIFLNLPPFLSGKKQFSKEEAMFCKKIASQRIHVERAIERLRNYKILNLITTNLRPWCNKLVQTCAALVNLQSAIINGVFDKYIFLVAKK
ncbi:uncharacterized protein LOC135685315 [Rhopilema esculentum]|uniref:uncharacterized protein LOC135685315 n=1 Tax=Rhopilema esculentum TaxID=499914 RepID=UPI0031D8C548